MIFTKFQKLSDFFTHWKKLSKFFLKIAPVLHPLSKFFSCGVPKGKNFLWETKRKKNLLGASKRIFLFLLVPQIPPKGSFFPFGTPKEKKLLKRWSTGAFFFFGNFFQCLKLLNIWKFVNIKVAKFKLTHLGFYCTPSLFL